MATTFTHSFVYELVTLFVILDPVSTIPIFLAATLGLARKDSLKVGAYAVSISFGVLLVFIAGGQLLLNALHIPMPSFQLAGSIVLLLFGLKLVLGKVTEEAAAIPGGTSLFERAIYPLAIPGIAGPGAMLTVVLLTDNNVRTRQASRRSPPPSSRSAWRSCWASTRWRASCTACSAAAASRSSAGCSAWSWRASRSTT